MILDDTPYNKREKMQCSNGDKCYRRNPAHFRDYSHPHLEAILDSYTGTGDYRIPPKYNFQRQIIKEQLEVIVEKQLYVAKKKGSQDSGCSSNSTHSEQVASSNTTTKGTTTAQKPESVSNTTQSKNQGIKSDNGDDSLKQSDSILSFKSSEIRKSASDAGSSSKSSQDEGVGSSQSTSKDKEPYRPVVPPTGRAQDLLDVVLPPGGMAAKHAASAPYHVFYTTITSAPDTHRQGYSITFQEILDRSLGELKCSLQINFVVEIFWLLAQYYFAGYSAKKLTILYGLESPDLETISSQEPQVDAHYLKMTTTFGLQHTKMMVLCYEDGSLRVVVSTANLYYEDWENRTQGLWFSPKCPELPPGAMPTAGDSPTGFKRSLTRYLSHYQMPQLSYYLERVKRCDFSHINVFLVASVPGSHFGVEWGMTRVGTLLRQHCCIPPGEDRQWPLIAQASSLGTYGNDPKLWLTGDFLHRFTMTKDQPKTLVSPPALKLIYPSVENVCGSHDGLLGGGCLPYAASSHDKQQWLTEFLYQWRATTTGRDHAMPHIKSYTRTSPDSARAAYYLLTSGNASKAAWGVVNKGDGALRIVSYEAGVMLLPRFVINEDYFPLETGKNNRLVLPYDLPPTKYTADMLPWVMDILSSAKKAASLPDGNAEPQVLLCED